MFNLETVLKNIVENYYDDDNCHYDPNRKDLVKYFYTLKKRVRYLLINGITEEEYDNIFKNNWHYHISKNHLVELCDRIYEIYAKEHRYDYENNKYDSTKYHCIMNYFIHAQKFLKLDLNDGHNMSVKQVLLLIKVIDFLNSLNLTPEIEKRLHFIMLEHEDKDININFGKVCLSLSTNGTSYIYISLLDKNVDDSNFFEYKENELDFEFYKTLLLNEIKLYENVILKSKEHNNEFSNKQNVE